MDRDLKFSLCFRPTSRVEAFLPASDHPGTRLLLRRVPGDVCVLDPLLGIWIVPFKHFTIPVTFAKKTLAVLSNLIINAALSVMTSTNPTRGEESSLQPNVAIVCLKY